MMVRGVFGSRPWRVLAIVLLVMVPAASSLAATGGGAGYSRALPRLLTLEYGVRLFSHYIPEREPWTPPRAFLHGLQLAYWYQRYVGFYGFAGFPLGGASSTEFGGGFKINIGSFDNSKRFISPLRLNLVVELARYTTEPPPDPYWLYDSSGFQLRYGGSMTLGLFDNRYFLEGIFLATRFSRNWCVAPYFGLGVNL